MAVCELLTHSRVSGVSSSWTDSGAEDALRSNKSDIFTALSDVSEAAVFIEPKRCLTQKSLTLKHRRSFIRDLRITPLQKA